MVNYLDSRRIMGTTSERSSIPAPATSGGWVEVGRTTLTSSGDSLSVTGLPNKRYYWYLLNGISTSDTNNNGIATYLQLNGDTGSNYASRRSVNGTEGTAINKTIIDTGASTGEYKCFLSGFIANRSASEKLVINHSCAQNALGATNAPERREVVGKWANTSNSVSAINFNNTGGTGDYASGAELVVLGWDPSDTHTTNFWEELASVELGSAGDTLSSGTITAKKYLWVQAWLKASGDCNHGVQFNNDTATNYSARGSYDGGADYTSTSVNSAIRNYGSAMNTSAFLNMFIINNQSNEKLVICHIVDQEASGSATAPHRQEQVGKWANTSNQITEIDIVNSDTGNYASGSILKVWGAD